MTSAILVNGLPFREEGGLDWRPIFATNIGCVITVAMAFDSMPRIVDD